MTMSNRPVRSIGERRAIDGRPLWVADDFTQHQAGCVRFRAKAVSLYPCRRYSPRPMQASRKLEVWHILSYFVVDLHRCVYRLPVRNIVILIGHILAGREILQTSPQRMFDA